MQYYNVMFYPRTSGELIFGRIVNYFFLRAKDLSKHYFGLTVLFHALYNMPGILI